MRELTPYSPLDMTDPCEKCGLGAGAKMVTYHASERFPGGRFPAFAFPAHLTYRCLCGNEFSTATKDAESLR